VGACLELSCDVFGRGGETMVNDDRNNGVVVVIGAVQWSRRPTSPGVHVIATVVSVLPTGASQTDHAPRIVFVSSAATAAACLL